MRRATRQCGATVVEMAIVATIAMTLLAAASPELFEFGANFQVRSAAESLRSGLRTAQVEALSRQAPVELVLTDDEPRAARVAPLAAGRNWVVRAVRADGEFDWVTGSQGADAKPRVRVQAERSVFAFDRFGRLSAEAGAPDTGESSWRITLVDRDSVARPLRVIVTSGGSSTACDPAAAATDSFACG